MIGLGLPHEERAEWAPPTEGPWTPADCVRALCALTEEVLKVYDGRFPSDCFCGFGGYNADGVVDLERFRNNGQAIIFIQNAVRVALRNEIKPALDNAKLDFKVSESRLQEAWDEAMTATTPTVLPL